MKEESAFNPMPHLDELLTQFETLATTALKIQSRNEQDDEFIRCGIVGFVQHSSSEHWDHSHFEYVRSHRNEVVDERFPADWCRFACLSAGYFLGMWEAGLIGDLARISHRA